MNTYGLSTTKVFDDVVTAAIDHRAVITYGGSSSSKTFSILQLLMLFAIYSLKKIAIVSISYPVFRRGLLPDLQKLMGPVWHKCKYNKVDSTLTFPNGSMFYFLTSNDASAAHGPRFDIAYFDELLLQPKAFYQQVSIRTKGKIFASFNPSNSGSWVRELEARDDVIFIHSTFRDNQYLDPKIIKELEHFAATDKNFRDVYLNGEWGNKEGLIFTDWEIGKFVGDPKYIGLDLAFSRDYTAAVAIKQDGKNIYCKEIIYEVGIKNQEICDILKPLKKRVIADSSHGMTIDFLQTQGVYAEPVRKYPGFVVDRISHAQGFHLIVDPGSVNLIKALEIYSWQERNGDYVNKPNHHFSDLPDALMYALTECGFRSKVRIRGKI